MDPPPGASYADVGAAWRAGSFVGRGLPSFAHRKEVGRHSILVARLVVAEVVS